MSGRILGYMVVELEAGRARVRELHSTKGWRPAEWTPRRAILDVKPGTFVPFAEPRPPEPDRPVVKITRPT